MIARTINKTSDTRSLTGVSVCMCTHAHTWQPPIPKALLLSYCQFELKLNLKLTVNFLHAPKIQTLKMSNAALVEPVPEPVCFHKNNQHMHQILKVCQYIHNTMKFHVPLWTCNVNFGGFSPNKYKNSTKSYPQNIWQVILHIQSLSSVYNMYYWHCIEMKLVSFRSGWAICQLYDHSLGMNTSLKKLDLNC